MQQQLHHRHPLMKLGEYVKMTTTSQKVCYFMSLRFVFRSISVCVYSHFPTYRSFVRSFDFYCVPTYISRQESIVVCPYCQQQVRTRVVSKIGICMILIIVIICFIFWPFFWIPLVCCGGSCKNKDHYCTNPKCGQRVGSYAPCGCYS